MMSCQKNFSCSRLPALLLLLIIPFIVGFNIEDDFISIPIAYVPASFPVDFSLYTDGDSQYVAFYDSTHQMTIARREINSSLWIYHKLDSKVGWDSHNYLSMVLDENGIIHLVGNMHSSELIYFRSSQPGDIYSMEEINYMTGSEEDITTYPEFKQGPEGELIFHYRYGISGSGYEIFNRWDSNSEKWIRLIDKPLVDGRGEMNAYMQGPVPGPDGYYHIIWVWRDTPDCSTNHTLSHARSRNLINWEAICGTPVELPITVDYSELWVDDTPVRGGLLNIGIKIGFDSKGNIVIGYHKYDDNGNTQLYLARFESSKWNSVQITDWDYRWDFRGYGSIVHELVLQSPKPYLNQGELVFGFDHIKYGAGEIVVNEDDFNVLRIEPPSVDYSADIDIPNSEFPGILVHKVFDTGPGNGDKKYLLRWEALPPNRDRKPEGLLPPPSLLELVIYK